MLSIGFRPFFLLATVSAIVLVPAWLGVVGGGLGSAYFSGARFHAHEMIFGFAVAVIAGFLSTAASVWTKRRIVSGTPLGLLAGLWVLGRLAPLSAVPATLAAALDVAFLPALGVALGRALIVARNRRNYVFLVMLALMSAANAAMHAEALGAVWQWRGNSLGGWGQLLALRVITLMILVVGGRVIPMFTRNGTRTPWIQSFGGLEIATMATFAAAALLQPFVPREASATLWLTASVVALVRMLPWAPWKARPPLLWILHFGATATALSLGAEGLSQLGAVPPTTPMHLLTVGGVGGLTIGMMARVSLGHSGRPLEVPPSVHWAFGLMVLATMARALGPWVFPRSPVPFWHFAGGAWCLAFALLLRFGWPIWWGPSVPRAPAR